eukprot:sb/3471610/
MLVNCRKSCNACGETDDEDDDDDDDDDDNDDDDDDDDDVKGKFLRAAMVSMSSQYYDLGAGYAVDGDLNAASHTECSGQHQWFKYYFDGRYSIGKIKVINGKFNWNRIRLDCVVVYAMTDTTYNNMASCTIDTIHVRDGETVDDQTYWLDCGGKSGFGLWFFKGTGDCLEFTEIEVYEHKG